MRSGGEPDRAHEVGEHRHLAARAGVLRVHRVLRREYGDHPARPDEPEGFEDEVVVHRLSGRVVHWVVQGHIRERHVPDHRVERSLGQTGVRERLAANLGVRIQRPTDGCGHRVKLDAGHVRRVRGHAKERAQPGTRLQHPAAVEAEHGHGPPHLPHDQRVGVVRVDRRARGGIPLFWGEQAPQLLALCVPVLLGFVENLGHRAPARPARKRLLLVGGRRAFLSREQPRGFDGGHVRVEAGFRARGGQIVVRGGHEPQDRRGRPWLRVGVVSSGG
ncbi:hypothetical protein ACFPRL_06680 [Pseudoclavibacter helvolus]